MSAGFGFSVGDFIAVVNLLRQVGNALKENGGARDDYRKTITKLETTKAILSCIEHFEDCGKDLATVHAIHALATQIQNDVERFLSKIEKYRSTIGSIQAKRFGYGTLAKIRWSQSVAGDVKRLYQDLDGKTGSLSLLFDLHFSNTSSRGFKDLASTRETILHAIDNHVPLSKTQLRPASIDALVKEDIDVLTIGLQGLTANHAKATDEMLSRMATKEDIRVLRSLLESRSQSPTSSQRNPLIPHDASRLRLVLTIPQLHLSCNEAFSILQNFSAEVTIVLKIFCASFLVCLKDLLLVLPQLILVYRVLRRLPPAISLVLHDNIAFEDALGRVHSLQFQQFKHWDVFEMNLRRTFDLVQGRQKVIRGDYVLTSPEYAGQLTSRNWALAIRPGFVVKMAISLTQIFVEERRCPRGCESATSQVKKTTEYCCGLCGLLFTIRKKPENVRPEKVVGNREPQVNISNALIEKLSSSETHQISGSFQDNLSSSSKSSSLSEEIEVLGAFKRIQLAETLQRPQDTQSTAVNTPASTQQYQKDTTGQVAPPGLKPRASATFWEDENTLCFQVEVKDVCVARREDNHFINGTKLFNVAGMTRRRRDGILKSEKLRHVVKIGPMHLKGVWIPFERALDFANREDITDQLYPLFVHNIGSLLYIPTDIDQTKQVPSGQNFRDKINNFRNQPGIAADGSVESYLEGTRQTSGNSGRHALHDYQVQLRLIEQQNKSA